MAKIKSFEKFDEAYDRWFIDNEPIYKLEIESIKNFIPVDNFGLEIGVGTGKFSIPFNISIGIDPSFRMAIKSKKQGIDVSLAIAESLPFKSKIFDFVLIVTSVCFFDDVKTAFDEAYRVLKDQGFIIIGFVDSQSYLGKQYQLKKNKSRFYKEAIFYSSEEIVEYLKNSGFTDFEFNQTVFNNNEFQKQRFKKGYGEGSFVVIKAVKEAHYE